ncbi:MAG: AAA family ATPase [Acholeplasmataceae bacterium]|nr:AAA family ATPase [Acholeplasmataceae bacterium]
MKENGLAKIGNVRKANDLIEYLKNRPKTEMVGLGLIYGQPGLGKSRFARVSAIQNDYIYLRLEASMTLKSFATKLLEMIYYHFDMPKTVIKGNVSQILDKSLEILRNYINTVIVIDEIDYAFNSRKILGTIRDIVDETLSIVILVGMSDAKENLLSLDSHYFDRCNFFCEFKPLNTDDIQLICKEICEVKIDPLVIKYLSSKTNGNIRKLIKILYSLENLATRDNLEEISIEHLTAQTKE